MSPAGRFAPDGTHVVDGSYFENSGAATALDILRQVNNELRQNAELHAVIPQIIMINNNPLGVAFGSRDLTMTKQALKNVARSAAAEAAQRELGTFLEDALAPAIGALRNSVSSIAPLLSARGAEDPANVCQWTSSVPLIGLSSKNCTVLCNMWLAKRNGINLDLSERTEMPSLKTRNQRKPRQERKLLHENPGKRS